LFEAVQKEILVIGASGHARVVISTLIASGWRVRAAYDDDNGKWNTSLLGVPVIGPVAKLGEDDGLPAIIAVGDPDFRRRVSGQYKREWITAIHPWSYVDPTATIGIGSVVFAGAVVQPEVAIGDHSIINTCASLDHECVIGNFAHISPGVHLAGCVRIGDGAFIGTGASIIRGLTVGDRSIVGAGAAVIRDVPPDVTVVGCPAKIIREHSSS
jgi:sugar O-acyltransferase (sialic acid O-acetyltransferase NeuD family)